MVPPAVAAWLATALRPSLRARARCDNPGHAPQAASQPREGRSHRHHLPRRATRVAGREREEAAAHEQRGRRPGGRARPHRPAARGHARGGQSARRINAEGERIIEKAQEEAEHTIARAQEQAAFLIEERELTEAAHEESLRIVAQAEDEAEEVRRGADEYAAAVLIGLEGDLVRTLQSIKKGVELLDERRAVLREPGAADGESTTSGWNRRRASPSPRGRDRGPGDGRPHLQRRRPPRRTTGNGPDVCDRRRDARPRAGPGAGDPVEGSIRIARTNRGVLVHGTAVHEPRHRLQPLPARPRGPAGRCRRRGSAAEHRHRDRTADRSGRGTGRDTPDRPPRARARADPPRVDPARGADRTALSPRLPRSVCRVRRGARRRSARARRGIDRPAPGGAPLRSGSTASAENR